MAPQIAGGVEGVISREEEGARGGHQCRNATLLLVLHRFTHWIVSCQPVILNPMWYDFINLRRTIKIAPIVIQFM